MIIKLTTTSHHTKLFPFREPLCNFHVGFLFVFAAADYHKISKLCFESDAWWSDENMPYDHCLVSLPASHEVKLFARCLKVEVETAIWCASDSYKHVTSINHCSFTHTITLWLSLVTTQLRFETLLNISEKSKNTSARSKKFPTGTS